MAAIDLPGFVADLKDHAMDHGFHVHDERHFMETYSLGQSWEVDLHPEVACGGPLDLHLSLQVDPRVLLGFEEAVMMLDDPLDEPEDLWSFHLFFNWAVPPLESHPDLLVLATDLAGLGGPELPIEVSATDTFADPTSASSRTLGIIGSCEVSLTAILLGREQLCAELDRSHEISLYLLDHIGEWTDAD
ncbi:MAG: hypothetical protein AB1Z57_03230 [Acidimicrobiia bacterium]